MKQLKVSEAAREMKISLDATYRLLYAGKLEGKKKDGQWVIEQAAVEQRIRKKGKIH
tara:strand:+ start:1450 stop:1620 length:171 start_codon:yes stop_codon:yes gene_type:complete